MKYSSNKGPLIGVAYQLFLIDENGDSELFEETENGKPYFFKTNEGSVLPAFEAQFLNPKIGDTFDFMINEKEAYGAYDPQLINDLPLSAFTDDDDELDEDIEIDEYIVMLDDEEQEIEGRVVAIHTDSITLDFNHPLAGKTLHYKGKILTVRN
jgi:FKBP-type peptidyl-prolyl cis-trans isomerase SlyD